jgi:bifunctional non-homologous end joining protein LigD
MGLMDYESKRKFPGTPEPEAGPAHKAGRLVFVVHKHAARSLHYDLRLELEGVLKSWAIPKGPSLDPSVKRLAVMVEDHPFEYKDFEGVIPEGNYGAGSVIIWDRGYWRHPDDVSGMASEKTLSEGLKKGNLKFVLEGEKLKGEFALVRTGRDGGKSWLLMKKRDAHAAGAILARGRSVVSHRSLEEMLQEETKGPGRRRKMERIRLGEAMEEEDLARAPVTPMPRQTRPMLATLAREPFDNEDWIFEIKWDGYRALAEIRDGKVSLYSRNLLSLNERFPAVRDALKGITFDALLDGEIVVVDDDGYPDFQMLEDYGRSGKGHLLYYVFDLLHFQGHDLTGLPLITRKDILKKVLPSLSGIRFNDHVERDGILFFRTASERGLEGIVGKHRYSTYRPGRRSPQWLKIKTRISQEAVIAGFTEPGGSRRYFGALVLGVHDGKDLVYIGHAGGGFSDRTLKEIRERLDPLTRPDCPFGVKPRTMRPVTWVEPELVCEVLFHGWTREGLMRQPTFLRMREDKDAREVVREEPRSAGEAEEGGAGG